MWDISQPGNKSPVSQLDCLVSIESLPFVHSDILSPFAEYVSTA